MVDPFLGLLRSFADVFLDLSLNSLGPQLAVGESLLAHTTLEEREAHHAADDDEDDDEAAPPTGAGLIPCRPVAHEHAERDDADQHRKHGCHVPGGYGIHGSLISST